MKGRQCIALQKVGEIWQRLLSLKKFVNVCINPLKLVNVCYWLVWNLCVLLLVLFLLVVEVLVNLVFVGLALVGLAFVGLVLVGLTLVGLELLGRKLISGYDQMSLSLALLNTNFSSPHSYK